MGDNGANADSRLRREYDKGVGGLFSIQPEEVFFLLMINCRDGAVARGLALEAHPSPAGDTYPIAMRSVEEAGLMAMLRASTPGERGEGRPIAAYDLEAGGSLSCHSLRI